MKNNYVIIIPTHLNSSRFKNKILYPILGLEMIEHVRRRVMLNKKIQKNVFIATCDKEIKYLVEKNNGKVIMTSNKHLNGTSRVSEAVKNINSTHVILLQGDEPLVDPTSIDTIIESFEKYPNYDVWNATSLISKSRMNNITDVKCIINGNGRIINFFRSIKKDKVQLNNNNKIRKVLGIIGFKTKVLREFQSLNRSNNESKLSIEQFKFLDNYMKIKSVHIYKESQSVNLKTDIQKVKKILKNDIEQKKIFRKINENYKFTKKI